MSKNKLIWILGIVIVLSIIVIYFYNYVLYKEARDIGKEESSYVLTSSNLIHEYINDIPASDLKFLNKTIQVKGTITEISGNTIVLDSTIFCDFNQKTDSKISGKQITIKGRCIGFDELFNQVKLDQCILMN